MCKKFTLLSVAFTLLVGFMFASTSFAQVTTGSIKGQVTDATNGELPGATVVAVETATGVKYATVTRDDGRFNFNNLNGGMYTITSTFVGFKEFQKVINVSIGEEAVVNLQMSDESALLSEVIVRADNNFNRDKQGSELGISNEQIQALPTVNRNLSDFTRLTPQVKVDGNGAVSVAGQNNRYNSIFIDGAANNDVFGLSASGTNGGQTGISPISVDAIEQFKVVISPYDVSLSGFTGGGINAVTRSGTNNTSGSIYYFFKNEKLTGLTPGTDANFADEKFMRTKLADFNSYTTGLRLGGALIKNKLFYFVNAEIQRDVNPTPFAFTNYQGALKEADFDALTQTLISKYGYDPGAYRDVVRETNSNKFAAKVDWNINQKNRLTVSHRYAYGESTSPSRSSNAQISFANGGVFFPSTTNSSSLELKSTISNKLSNRILVGYTTVLDDRDPIGGDFPSVFINQTATRDRISFGSEAFSTANQLNSNIFTFNQKLDYYVGKHSISTGIDGELGSFYNLFIRQNYGAYTYASLADFLNDRNPTDYARSYSLLPDDITGDGSKAAAEFKSGRYGVFLNDKFDISPKFSLSGGVRVDLNTFPTDGFEDKSFNTTSQNAINAVYPLEGARAGFMPSGKVTVSPRIGFNYDVAGDKTFQIRGGTGIFLGRVPMVWPGGVYTNSGVIIGGVLQRGITNTKPFIADISNQYTQADFGGENRVPSGELNLVTENFKLPSVLRSNLAVDKKFNGGWVVSLEGIFTQNINDVAYLNVNLDRNATKTAAGADSRTIYNPTGSSPIRIDLDGSTAGIQNPYTGDIFLMKNADREDNGYSYNLTARVEKSFTNGLTSSLSYTFGESRVLNEATSSQNASQWRFMESVNGRNNLTVSRSDFDLGHRIVGFVNYSFNYLQHATTSVSLFYTGQSGSPFSYVYRNSIVNDRSRTEGNDLVFVPATKDQIVFTNAATADAQWAALNEYIENDKYLRTVRGSYAERNGARTPFTNVFDFKVTQDIYLNIAGKKNTFQVTWDVFNVGNLLNKSWGRQYFVSNDNFQLATFDGFRNAAQGDFTPRFTFAAPNGEPWNISDGATGNTSRWTSQIGLRYIFN